MGWGGISAVSRATGISRKAISHGIKELQERGGASTGRVRRKGGGRKQTVSKDASLREDLERLVEPATRGDPESPLRWTCKSIRKLAKELSQQGHQVSHQLVRELLHELGYSLQANRKTHEGADHPDRDGQFKRIAEVSAQVLAANQPLISVDTKKKELIGNYKNGGRELAPTGKPILVNTHDFIDQELGKAIPYGIYDVGRDEGWVSVGISADTAQFAVAAIKSWWQSLGRKRYPKAKTLTITADCGGSNGYRTRLWKTELQKLADDTGLQIVVCHFPPGTSKWNKVEHRLFSFISRNWRGQPLISYEVIINLIAATTTSTGLEVYARLDPNEYPKVEVTDAELAAVNLTRDAFHGEWNYTIKPSDN